MKSLLANLNSSLNIVSLFAGCGGLDLGFAQAGFKTIWANEWDKEIWHTYESNHVNTHLDHRDIREIASSQIPDCIGIVGGPPCQSWSEAGRQKGIKDDRGRLFLEYVRILQDKQPLFFLAENVSGMLHQKHSQALKNIIAAFEEAGYEVRFKLLDAVNFNVPQQRKRVIFVGFRQDLERAFDFERKAVAGVSHVEAIEAVKTVKQQPKLTLKDAIWDLRASALAAKAKNKTNDKACLIPNHEYATGGFSSMYMSRNRVRSWQEPSFTIQASCRHAPIHPHASKMINVARDKFIFDPDSPYPYHRLSVRECARIQTFPDDFIFYYQNLNAGYKMIGNAVPVNLSWALATAIKEQLLNPAFKNQQKKEPSQLNLDLNLTLAN
ncbi:DNA cytosine methyltransferase [Pleurocapsa sp. FMAR1]|uniref:DNA cytosine methyltransferase n=1 Tax=Pleurocapsa sp. FMAR1 TaxID=3040204 RepID=UPI0029C7EFB7|nr:DNA cytosine methyltransferase [Pleurocapsa sp. FMAR1]